MVSYLLKLKRIELRPGSEIHPHTYLFRTSMKKSKKDKFESEVSISSSTTINVEMEKDEAKKRKLVNRKELPPPLLMK